jgi:L-ribulose-5-phosphate 3-epimerase
VLERSIEMAKALKTDRVRFFDFWRLEDQTPYRAAINEKSGAFRDQKLRRFVD